MAGSHASSGNRYPDTLQNEAWLKARYLDERMTGLEIARLLGCSGQSVSWALRKFAIPVRSSGESRRGRPIHTVWTPERRAAAKGSHAPRPKKNRDTLHNEAWLRAKYLDERLSANDIAALLQCSQPTVFWALKKFSIPTRTMAEGKRGRPSTTVWTPEMREALAAKRRGELNPMYGTVSPWAGRHLPIDQTTRHYNRVRARIIHPARPCEECGDPKAQRHHLSGNTSDNSVENIRFLCLKHHLEIGHNGHWGDLNLPPGMSDERLAGPPLTKKPPMTPEQDAAWRAELRERGLRNMTHEKAVAMARRSHELHPMTPERAREMGRHRKVKS